MSFDLTQDQRDFAGSLRSFFDAEYGDQRLRAVVDDGKPYDAQFWRTMVDDLDLPDRKSTRLNSSHGYISYAVFCLRSEERRVGKECRSRWSPYH